MSVAVVADVSLRECCVLAPSECSIWFLCPSSFGGTESALPVIPAPVAIVRVHIIGSVLLTLGLPDYRALADVCLSQSTS